MRDVLKLASVAISGRQIAPIQQRDREASMDVITIAVDVVNLSDTRTIFVIDRVRSRSFDDITGTLSLHFRDPAQEGLPSRLRPPSFAPVKPNSGCQLVARVPVVSTDVVFDNTGVHFTRVDIAGLKRITCEVGYALTPFYAVVGEGSDDLVRRVRKWSEATVLSVEAKLPGIDSGA